MDPCVNHSKRVTKIFHHPKKVTNLHAELPSAKPQFFQGKAAEVQMEEMVIFRLEGLIFAI